MERRITPLTTMSGSNKFRLMRKHTSISPSMRGIAAVVLVCWSVALAVCWNHCATGACSRPAQADDQPSCHGHVSSEGEDTPASGNSAENACFAKKPFVSQLDVAHADSPSLHLAYVSALLLAQYEFQNTSETVGIRQATLRDWVFTPEVSLGPAFRSLAPPGLA